MPSAPARIPTVKQVSAGGVAFRVSGSEVQVALISVGERKRWQLPKGTVEEGETREAAAVREVREETGIQTVLIKQIERIEYWFFTSSGASKTRHHKFVYFFLLRAVSGDIRDHDSEVNESRWLEINAARTMLEFVNERRVLEKASAMIGRLLRPPARSAQEKKNSEDPESRGEQRNRGKQQNQ